MAESTQPATEQLIEGLARKIGQRRLETPAAALLELARPLSFIASQGLLLVQPLLGSLLGDRSIAGYADLLADRTNVDRLIARLEQPGTTSKSGGGED